MKYALSARYGGLLVEPNECDYTSFKHLHLLCPECKRSVYLVAGAERKPHERKLKDGGKAEVKGATIEPYFAHHPDVSKLQMNDCELRVSKLSAIQREAIRVKAKQQLVKTLHTHFWKILNTSQLFLNPEDNAIVFESIWIKSCACNHYDAKNYFNSVISLVCNAIKSSGVNLYTIQVNAWLEKEVEWQKSRSSDFSNSLFLKNLKSTLERKIHKSIVIEIISFLLQKKQLPILEIIVKYLLFYIILIHTIFTDCEKCSFYKGALFSSSSNPLEFSSDSNFLVNGFITESFYLFERY